MEPKMLPGALCLLVRHFTRNFGNSPIFKCHIHRKSLLKQSDQKLIKNAAQERMGAQLVGSETADKYNKKTGWAISGTSIHEKGPHSV
jgi:hypothetical protein